VSVVAVAAPIAEPKQKRIRRPSKEYRAAKKRPSIPPSWEGTTTGAILNIFAQTRDWLSRAHVLKQQPEVPEGTVDSALKELRDRKFLQTRKAKK
jgi:hypothetical protein